MEAFSEKITVECAGDPPRPVAFTWRGEEFRIAEVLTGWHDYGFPAGSPRKKNFRMRRHRNYYVVRTETGRRFEIYLDRKGPDTAWVLYREV